MALLSHMFRRNVICKKCICSTNIRLLSFLHHGNTPTTIKQRYNKQFLLLRRKNPTFWQLEPSAIQNCGVVLNVHYLSSQSKTPTSSITDEILKGRIKETVESHDSTSEQKSSGSRSEDTKEKSKAQSWFSPKNAWKLGLLSLGAMTVLTCGNLLFVWGLYFFHYWFPAQIRPPCLITPTHKISKKTT